MDQLIEDREDFYLLTKEGETNGCCLLCEDARAGCLCYYCKCRKCYWYIAPEDWNGEKGRCRFALKLKERRKKNGNTKATTA